MGRGLRIIGQFVVKLVAYFRVNEQFVVREGSDCSVTGQGALNYLAD